MDVIKAVKAGWKQPDERSFEWKNAYVQVADRKATFTGSLIERTRFGKKVITSNSNYSNIVELVNRKLQLTRSTVNSVDVEQ